MERERVMKKRILIIDDEPDIYYGQISSLIQTGKYEIDIASNPQIAKNLIKEEHFDLIILDMIMPPIGIDNSELEVEGGLKTGWVFYKSNLKKSNTPVILWTPLVEGVFDLDWGSNVIYKILKKPIGSELSRMVEDFFTR